MTDPAVQAVAEALCQPHGEHYTRYIDPDPSQRPRALATAQVAVDAYRRHVLASHPDAERLQLIRGWVGSGHAGPAAETTRYLLAALADETAARQATEADRDREVVREEAWRYVRPNRGGKVHRLERGLRVHRFMYPVQDEWEFVSVADVPKGDLCQTCWD